MSLADAMMVLACRLAKARRKADLGAEHRWKDGRLHRKTAQGWIVVAERGIPTHVEESELGHGWTDHEQRDGAVVAALHHARGVEAVEQILRGVRHREFAVALDAAERVVGISGGPLVEETDSRSIVPSEGRVRFPQGTHVVIVSHNHPAMTPLSAGDIVAAVQQQVQRMRAVNTFATWELQLESRKPLSAQDAAGMRTLLDQLISNAEGTLRDGYAARGWVHNLTLASGVRIHQIDERHVATWNADLATFLDGRVEAGLAEFGIRGRLRLDSQRASGTRGSAGLDRGGEPSLLRDDVGGAPGAQPTRGDRGEEDGAQAVVRGRHTEVEKAQGRRAEWLHALLKARDRCPALGPPPSPNRKDFPFVASLDYQGIPIDVEQRKGDVREGVDMDGTPWRVVMHAHYGEVRSHARGASGVMGAKGQDGDRLDVYVGDDPGSDLVVVVDQRVPETGEHDEQKVMLGFGSVAEALDCYRRQYTKPGFYGGHTVMSVTEFKDRIGNPSQAGQALTKALLDLLLKARFKRKIPTGKFRTKKDGTQGAPIFRYVYTDEGAARGAQAGEHVNFQKKGGGVHEVVHADHEGVTLKHAKTGEEKRLSHEEFHERLATAWRRDFDRGAEALVRRYVAAAQRVQASPDDPEAVMRELGGRFKAARVDPEHAQRLVSFLAARPGWDSDAKRALLAMASDPKAGRVVAPRARQIARGAENLSRAEGAKQVESRHVGRAAVLRVPAGGFDVQLADTRQRVAVELAHTEALLGAIEAATGNEAMRRALVDHAMQAIQSQAGHELEQLAEAFPGLRDMPELGRLKSARAKMQAHRAEREVQRKPGKEGLSGAPTTVYVADADGRPVPQRARYRLVEAKDAIASHDPIKGFARRKDYPEGVQERTYHSDKAEQDKVRSQAQGLRPSFVLNTNPDAVNGPPVMTRDGIVLGGNSRTMSVQLAYHAHPEAAERYRDHLRANAHEFGFAHGDVDAFEQPILVREVDTDGATRDHLGVLVRRYNESFTQGMDPRADQVARGRMVTTRMLDAIASGMARTNDVGEPLYATLKEFLSSSDGARFVSELSSSSEGKAIIDRRNRSQYVAKDGKLNEDGKVFVERVLVGHVLPDPELLSDMLPKHVSAIAAAVPHAVSAAAKGHDVKGALKDALHAFTYMRKKGLKSLDEYERDSGGFGGFLARSGESAEGFEQKPDLDKTGRSLLGVLVDKIDKPVQLAGFFREFAGRARQNPAGQASMFGESADTATLLEQAATRTRGGQRDMFKALQVWARRLRTPAPGWLELPEAYGERLYLAQIFKAAGHRYVKRVPTGRFRTKKDGSPGAPIYRYYYAAHEGGGVHADDHMVVGAGFRANGGHWHIRKIDGDNLTVEHDETKETLVVTKGQLASKLKAEHAAKLAEVAERRAREIEDVRQHGSDAHRKRAGLPTRAEEEAKKPLASYEGEEGMRAEVFRRPDGKFVTRLRDTDLSEDEQAKTKAGMLGLRVFDSLDDAKAHAASLVAPAKVDSIAVGGPGKKGGKGLVTSATAKPKADSSPRGEHQRSGEHVAGARRDLAGLSAEEMVNLAPDERKRLLTKANLHTVLTAKEAREQGWSPGAHALYKAAFAAILPSPPVPAKSDAEDQRKRMQSAYIDGVTFLTKKLEAAKGSLKETVAALEEIGQALSREYREHGPSSPTLNMYPDRKGARSGLRVPERPMSMRILALGSALAGLVNAAPLLARGYRGSRVQKSLQERVKEAVALEAQGWEGAAEEADSKSGRGSRERFIFSRKVSDAPERKGGRPVERVGADALRDEFGFHEVDFGNWVSQEDREHHLKWCHGAFRDLEDVLGIPSGIAALKTLGSKSGRNPLAVAFGARGKGGALAHYEPFARDAKTRQITPTINLTRFGGGGSLAHEWGHFLDNVLGEAHAPAAERAEAEWLSSVRPHATGDAIPSDLRKAAADLMGAIRASDFARDAALFKSQYWSQPHEMFARAFESYVEDKLHEKGMRNSYLVDGTRAAYQTGVETRRSTRELYHHFPGLEAKHQAAKDASNKAREAFFSHPGRDAAVRRAVADAESKRRLGELQRSRIMQDAATAWEQTPEGKAARAAVTAADGAERDLILRHHRELGERQAQVYPQAHERKKFAALFDNLFAVIAQGNHLEKAMSIINHRQGERREVLRAELEERFGESLWSSMLSKAGRPTRHEDGTETMALPWWARLHFDPRGLLKAGGSYVKRVPTGKFRTRKDGSQGAQIYRYFYEHHHGGGVHNADDFKEGTHIAHGDGHFKIHSAKDGVLTVSHSKKPGKTEKLTHAELAARLREHHKDKLDAHIAKLEREHKDALETGNTKGAAKIREEAARLGHMIAEPAKPKPSEKTARVPRERAAAMEARSAGGGVNHAAEAAKLHAAADRAERDAQAIGTPKNLGQHKNREAALFFAEKTREKAREAEKRAAEAAEQASEGPPEPTPEWDPWDGGAPPQARKPAGEPEPKPEPPKAKVEHALPGSSNMARIGWTPNKEGTGKAGHGTMRVHFANESAYDYHDVPFEKYEAVRRREVDGSAGRTFNTLVKPHHVVEKVSSGKADPGDRPKSPDRQARDERIRARAEADKERKEGQVNLSPAPQKSLESHVADAAKLYGLSEKDVEHVQRHDYHTRAKEHAERGEHDKARDLVRLAVKDRLARDPDRGLSPSSAERLMAKKEKAAGLKKALWALRHGRIAA